MISRDQLTISVIKEVDNSYVSESVLVEWSYWCLWSCKAHCWGTYFIGLVTTVSCHTNGAKNGAQCAIYSFNMDLEFVLWGPVC